MSFRVLALQSGHHWRTVAEVETAAEAIQRGEAVFTETFDCAPFITPPDSSTRIPLAQFKQMVEAGNA